MIVFIIVEMLHAHRHIRVAVVCASFANQSVIQSRCYTRKHCLIARLDGFRCYVRIVSVIGKMVDCGGQGNVCVCVCVCLQSIARFNNSFLAGRPDQRISLKWNLYGQNKNLPLCVVIIRFIHLCIRFADKTGKRERESERGRERNKMA